MVQLKVHPSEKEATEAQHQLSKSDEMQRLVAQAKRSYDSRDYATATALLDTIIEAGHFNATARSSSSSAWVTRVLVSLQTCVWDVSSREMRADCFIQMGEMGKAISDLKVSSKLRNDNTQAFYQLSTIYYNLGDHEMSLK